MKKNVIKDKSYDFALETPKLVKEIPKNYASSTLIKQLVRSSTSAGANVEEALSAFTKSDFIYKMNLSLK